jgi:hypothetical protein
MKRILGKLLGRGDITLQKGWVIVRDNKIIEHYTLFEDGVKDKRGHLMTKEYYLNHYKNLDI